MKKLVLVVALLSVTACSDSTSPTAPSAVGSVHTSGPSSTGSYSAAITTDFNPRQGPCSEMRAVFHDRNGEQQLGYVLVTNLSACDHYYTYVIWDYTNDHEQTPLAQFRTFIKAGGRAELTVSVVQECGKRYQADVYMDAPSPVTTLNEVKDLNLLAPGELWKSTATECGGNPPAPPPPPPLTPSPTLIPPPPPPPPPTIPPPTPTLFSINNCQENAFIWSTPSQHDRVTIGAGTASVTLTLAPGFDNIVVYFASYRADTAFPEDAFGHVIGVTYPQFLAYQSTVTVHAGPPQTITVPFFGTSAAWQVDLGCELGPDVLNQASDYTGTLLAHEHRNNK